MAVSKRVRFEVLRRDDHLCRYCGAGAPEVKLTVDHVVPVALGGSDDPSNLVAACEPCNSGKSSMPADAPIVAEVQEKALQWAQAIAIAAQERAAARAEHDETCAKVGDRWRLLQLGKSSSASMPADWEVSVRTFLDSGLEEVDLLELVTVAMKTRTVTNKWKYFCGCCWTRIRDLHDRARQILDAQQPDDAELLTASTDPEEVDGMWEAVAASWKARGFDLAMCVCGTPAEFCGDYGCRLHVAATAHGALLEEDDLIQAGLLFYPEALEGESDGA